MLELDEACGGLLRALRVDGDHRDITSPIFAPSTVTPSKRFRPTWTSTFIVGCPLWGNQLFATQDANPDSTGAVKAQTTNSRTLSTIRPGFLFFL